MDGNTGFDFAAFEEALGAEDEQSQTTASEETTQDSPDTTREGADTSGQADSADTSGEGEGAAEAEDVPPEIIGPPPEMLGEAGNEPAQTPEPRTISIEGGKDIVLGADVLAALQSATGADPEALIQKGLSYDRKAQRELALLDRYAGESGMTRERYLDALENMVEDRKLQSEIEKARGEFPDAPEDALALIARQRREAEKARERQREDDDRKALKAGRERVRRMVEETRRRNMKAAADEYEKVSGVRRVEDIPERVRELVREGMTPVAAHWRYTAETEQAKAKERGEIERKQAENRAASPGSMRGAGADGSDAFLRGLWNG